MIVAAIYISMYGVNWTNDGSQKPKRPDVIFCDQISACIPFLKEVRILSRLLPYSPKVINLKGILLNKSFVLKPKLHVNEIISSHSYV